MAAGVAQQHLAGGVRSDLLPELLRDGLADRLDRPVAGQVVLDDLAVGTLGPPGDRFAVHGDRGLLDDLLGEDPHRVVVAVGLVQLQRGELGVVLEVRALVAELLAHLEHLLHAADDQPLEVQLGGDAEVEVEVVRVDVGLERPGVGAAVDQLQDRRLDLGEAAPGQRVADAAHHRRPGVGDVARLRSDDQVDVAGADPGLGVGQSLVLVRQRPQRLAGQLQRRRLHRQLALVGGHHLTGHPDVVAEVDVVLPQVEQLVAHPLRGRPAPAGRRSRRAGWRNRSRRASASAAPDR